MKITLIALPWILPKAEFLPHEGFSQNLGIACLGAYAEQHGHSVFVIDSFAEGVDNRKKTIRSGKELYIYGLSAEETAERIPDDTDLVGISCPFNSQAFLIERVAVEIKRRFSDKLLVLGGAYATTFPKEALTSNIDVVVRGEGEIPLLNLLSGKPLSEIQGVLFRQDNSLIDNGLAPVVDDMDTLPFPARHLLPMSKYFQRSQRGSVTTTEKTITIITSRGCPFDCNFCSLHNLENDYGRKWRARSPENVMKEIDQLINQYGKIRLEFEDDNILINRARAKELFTQLKKYNVEWLMPSGIMINLLDEELLMLIKESGCIQLNLALESGNDIVLKAMNKKVDLLKAEQVVKFCNKLKINILVFLMVGYPGETEETFQQTLFFLKKLRSKGLKKIVPFIVNPHRATHLYEQCKQKGYLTNIEDNISNAGLVSIVTEDFDEDTVRRWLDLVRKIICPCRWYFKYCLRKMLPMATYDKCVAIYHKVRL